MYALQHPRTCTLHTNRVFTTFVLSIFILTLSYTHSLLSPCFSFFLSFSFFGLVAHTWSLDKGSSSCWFAIDASTSLPIELFDYETAAGHRPGRAVETCSWCPVPRTRAIITDKVYWAETSAPQRWAVSPCECQPRRRSSPRHQGSWLLGWGVWVCIFWCPGV